MSSLFWFVVGAVTGALVMMQIDVWWSRRVARLQMREAVALTEWRHPAHRVPPEDRDDWPPAGGG